MKWLNLHGSSCLHRQARECLQTRTLVLTCFRFRRNEKAVNYKVSKQSCRGHHPPPDCVGREPYYNSTNWILLARNYIEHCETVKQKTQPSGWQKNPNSAPNFVHFVAPAE